MLGNSIHNKSRSNAIVYDFVIKNKFRYRVVTLSMGYYILFDYVHVFYVLLFTRYSCNIANVCVKHQSINQSMIYYYLLLTKRKYMHNISVRQCIHLRIECILLKFHWGMKALTETQVWKRWPKYIFNWNVLRSTLSYPNETSKECIENVLRSTLSYPYETSKECIQFL